MCLGRAVGYDVVCAGEIADGMSQCVFEEILLHELVDQYNIWGVWRCSPKCKTSCHELLSGRCKIGSPVYDGYNFALGRDKLRVCWVVLSGFLKYLMASRYAFCRWRGGYNCKCVGFDSLGQQFPEQSWKCSKVVLEL